MVAAEFQALLDAAVDAIVVIDDQGQIITFNRAAERHIRHTRRRTFIGQPVDLLMPEPHRSRHDGYLGAISRRARRESSE